MNSITNLDEYLEAERQADALYEKPHLQHELDRLIELMSRYEEANPKAISEIYGDATNLPDADSTYEEDSTWDYWPTTTEADY